MAFDISGIQSNVASAANVILVTPDTNIGIQPQLPVSDPQDPSGIKGLMNSLGLFPDPPRGFLFHVPGEDTVELSTDITNHFAEDNTSLQDQAALAPEIVVAQGFIGELNNVTPPELLPLKLAADKLSLLSPFAPGLSATAIRVYNTAAQVYATAKLAQQAALSAFNFVTGGDAEQIQSEQQKAYTLFEGYWKARQLFTVQTPWAIFNDMMIKTLRVTQTGDDRMISDFEITFQKMRFAKTILKSKLAQGRANAQSALVADKGVSKPVSDVSASDKITSSGLE